MSIDLEEAEKKIKAHQTTVENLTAARERLQGKYEACLDTLSKEFDVGSIGEAEDKLANMKKTGQELETKLEEYMEEFDEQYGMLLADQ